eukprot:GEMP01139214.1.p1 GENE.GEMP01139214.1~~GEMP01139214.1.p1  ORF type:complete len:101 (+),score=13.31 GEMP01139214.1:60-362(+)
MDDQGRPLVHVPGAPLKQCRSCMNCRILLTLKQFCQTGCPNCPELNMQNDEESAVISLTTSKYQGCVSLMKHGGWVSRFCQLGDDLVRGCYAVNVQQEDY